VTSLPTKSALLVLTIAIAAFGTGVFVLPYAIPTSSRVISASTLVGFNNAAAYSIYILLLILTSSLLVLAWRAVPLEASVGVTQLQRWTPTALVWTILIGHALVFAGVYARKGHLVFADGMYFHQILARMAEGAVPYRDVNFLYGPAMLYPAYWLSQYLSVTDAYAFYYVAAYVAGLYLLYLCVQTITGLPTDRMFVFCSLGLFNAVLGLNYVLLRFLLPIASVLVAASYLRDPRPLRFLWSVLILYITFTYSLEMGILAALSIMALATLRVLQPRFAAAAACGNTPSRVRGSGEDKEAQGCLKLFISVMAICFFAAAALLGTLWIIDPTFQSLSGYLKPMLVYSAGGGNRPLSVSLPFLGIMVIGTLTFGILTSLARQFDDRAVLFLGLLVAALMMLRPAFGKPDVLHIAYSGLPILLLGFAVVPNKFLGFPLRKAFLLLVFLTLMMPLQVYNLVTYVPVTSSPLRVANETEKDSVSRWSRRSIENGLDRIVNRFGTNRTYYLHALGYYSLPVVLQRHLKQVPYLVTLEEAFTDEDIKALIDELQNSQAVIVSLRRNLQPLGPFSTEGIAGKLLELMAMPAPGSFGFAETVEANDRLRAPLIEFIRSSYVVAVEDGELVALVPARAQ
jgi:hypothetical protein